MGDTGRSLGVVIGRFQPFHNGHLDLLESAAEHCDRLVICIGSAHQSVSLRNPLTALQREEIISRALPPHISGKVAKIAAIRDYYYNDLAWITEVHQAVQSAYIETESSGPISIIGHVKDGTSSYLTDQFPDWNFIPAHVTTPLDATTVRTMLFEGDERWRDLVPSTVAEVLAEQWLDTEEFRNLQDEHRYITNYVQSYGNVPYPVVNVCTDVVCCARQHVLVVQRGGFPGKGQLALPGGYLDIGSTCQESALRELREETNLKVSDALLSRAITQQRVYDYPNRNVGIRKITHVYKIDLDSIATALNLPSGMLPAIQSGDDAAHAMWMPIPDALAREDRWFEDHYQILTHILHLQ